ncbi:MAG: hypothetical protein PWP23_263 [Candidatus Sumerlaeota bacterium]|nr:hypothetical protein [Candidatus Sumerlaeota bacterium]
MVSRPFAATFAAATVAAALMTSGCASSASLREGNYEDVTPHELHRAGKSGDAELAAPLRALLEERLASGTTTITDEQAIEAVIALGRTGDASDGAAMLRVAREDHSPDVRAFAIEALARLNPPLLAAERGALLSAENDPLVRARLADN